MWLNALLLSVGVVFAFLATQTAFAEEVFIANDGECAAGKEPCLEGPQALKLAAESGLYDRIVVLPNYRMSGALGDTIYVHPTVEEIVGSSDPRSVVRVNQDCPSSAPASSFAFFTLGGSLFIKDLEFVAGCDDAGPHAFFETESHSLTVRDSVFRGNADSHFIQVSQNGEVELNGCLFSNAATALLVNSTSGPAVIKLNDCHFADNHRDLHVLSDIVSFLKVSKSTFLRTKGSASLGISANNATLPVSLDILNNSFRELHGSAVVLGSTGHSHSIVSFNLKNNEIVGCSGFALEVLTPFQARLDIKHNNIFANNGASSSSSFGGDTPQMRVEEADIARLALDGNYWGEGASLVLLLGVEEAWITRLGAPLVFREDEIGTIGFEDLYIDLGALQVFSESTDEEEESIHPWSVGYYTSAPFAQPFFPLICTPFFQIRYVFALNQLDHVQLSIGMQYNQSEQRERCVEVIEGEGLVPLIWYYSLQQETALPLEGGGWTPFPSSLCSLGRGEKMIWCKFNRSLEGSNLVEAISHTGIALAVFLMEPTQALEAQEHSRMKTSFISNTANFVLFTSEEEGEEEEEGQDGVAVFAEFASLTELSSDGAVISSQLIPKEQEVDSANSSFSAIMPNGARLQWSFRALQAGEEVSFGEVVFRADRESSKWSIRVEDWPFVNQDEHLLRLRFKLFPQRPFTEKREEETEREEVRRHILSNEGEELTMSLLNFALVDGAEEEKREVMVEFSEDLSMVSFTFPSFLSHVEYDPDLSLLLSEGVDGGGDGGDGDGEGKDDDEPNDIVVIAVPTAVGVVVLAGVVVGAVLLVLRLHQHNVYMQRVTRTTKHMNA
ncbi:hypothetical protein QOT17_021873 [Balamuthia mandrillaris]